MKHIKQQIRSLALYASFFLVLSGCEQPQLSKASQDIVLKIGDYEVTKYQFDKEYEKRFSQTKKNDNVSIKKWLAWYIENSYMIADAYKKRLDTCYAVKLKEQYAEWDMASSVGSYYWNKIIEPTLDCSNKEIREAYKKRSHLYYFEFLVSPDKESMDLALKSFQYPKNNVELKNIALSIPKNGNVKFVAIQLKWPYKQLEEFKDELFNLKPGEITKPLYGSNYVYIISLKKIEAQKQDPYKNEKQKIIKELKDLKIQNIVAKKQKEILDNSNTQLNDKLIEMVFTQINNGKLSSSNYSYLLSNNDTLMSFKINNKTKFLSVGDFINYYYNTPFIHRTIKEKQDIILTLQFLVLQLSMHEDLINNGVLDEIEFQLEKKIYTGTYLVDEYYRKEITSVS